MGFAYLVVLPYFVGCGLWCCCFGFRSLVGVAFGMMVICFLVVIDLVVLVAGLLGCVLNLVGLLPVV